MEYHFIYLIKEKQDIDTNEPIFKIGKSTQENTRRVKSYPSGSHLLLQVAYVVYDRNDNPLHERTP